MVAKQAQIDFLGQFTPVESHTENLSSIIITMHHLNESF